MMYIHQNQLHEYLENNINSEIGTQTCYFPISERDMVEINVYSCFPISTTKYSPFTGMHCFQPIEEHQFAEWVSDPHKLDLDYS